MHKSVAIFAIGATSAVLVAFGCGDDTGSDGSSNGGSNGQTSSGTTIPSACADIGPINDEPKCDECTRALCCPQVTDCENSAKCTDLRECLGACKQGDSDCRLACGEDTEGSRLLAGVSTCALKNCPDVCGTATVTPDGG